MSTTSTYFTDGMLVMLGEFETVMKTGKKAVQQLSSDKAAGAYEGTEVCKAGTTEKNNRIASMYEKDTKPHTNVRMHP